jgi:hypothetical protein
MFSESEVLVNEQQRLNTIIQINLKTHEVLYFNHKFDVQIADMNINIFS